MRNRKTFVRVTLLVFSLALPYPATAANDAGIREKSAYSAALGIEYSNGDYGTGTATDAVATRLTVGWYPTGRIDLSLEIPYLYQSNSITTPFGMGRFRTARVRQGNPSAGFGRSGGSSFAAGFDVNESQSGLGDLILRGGYIVLRESGAAPQIRPEAYVKLPTADERKGLGTGEPDGGIGVTLSKWFGNWNGYGEGMYNFIGKSADFDLNDYFSYEGGLGYQLTDRFFPSIAVKGATSPSSDSKPYLEARIRALYRITGRWGLDLHAGKGFTDGTPDYTLGMQIFRQF